MSEAQAGESNTTYDVVVRSMAECCCVLDTLLAVAIIMATPRP
jgi:hypothetical protein